MARKPPLVSEEAASRFVEALKAGNEQSVALDYAADKVRANALAPGAIDTPFLQRSFKRAADPAAARQRSIDRHPMGRFGTVEEVAKAALFLASDESSFTTGSVLMVEGGWNAA